MYNNTKHSFFILAVSAAVSLGLGACSGGGIQAADVNPTESGPGGIKDGPGILSGKSGNILDAFRPGGSEGEGFSLFGNRAPAGGTLGVNAFIWRAALETVSFLPLQSADSNGGVIITDWRTRPDLSSERVKATVYIFGTQLTAQATQVVIFKQMLQNGQWVDVAADETTARKLEDLILTKARNLKVASQQPQ